jgi:hypothetical protein
LDPALRVTTTRKTLSLHLHCSHSCPSPRLAHTHRRQTNLHPDSPAPSMCVLERTQSTSSPKKEGLAIPAHEQDVKDYTVGATEQHQVCGG